MIKEKRDIRVLLLRTVLGFIPIAQLIAVQAAIANGRK